MIVLEPRDTAQTYQLLEPLGRGGFAETWKARRLGGPVSADVCVKLPKPLAQAQQRRLREVPRLGSAERQALLEEARLQARIQHNNVVRLLAVHEERDTALPFLVLELVDGLDLAQVSKRLVQQSMSLSPAVCAAIGAALTRGLAAAQRAVVGGVVHRDVSPANVLVSREGEVKLTDFGIARALQRERWTRTGVVKGKASYVSPEQIRGRPLDVRSDLFCVGIILFELLTNEHPFASSDESPRQRLRAIAQRRPRRLRELRSDLDPRLLRLVEELLQPHPDARPTTADYAALRFERCCDGERAGSELRMVLQRLSDIPGVRYARRTVRPVRAADAAARR